MNNILHTQTQIKYTILYMNMNEYRYIMIYEENKNTHTVFDVINKQQTNNKCGSVFFSKFIPMIP